SWQPVGKPLDAYKTECRHGTAYTVISSEYANIKTTTTYFVPLGRYFECRLLKVTNQDTKKRQRKAFTFEEYANNWSTWQNTVNLQYTLNILGIQAFIYTLKKADFFFRVLPVSVGCACHGIHEDFTQKRLYSKI
ncbi:MAG: hypothetical protein P8107_05725, partial [Spirochaetia bacterium]